MSYSYGYKEHKACEPNIDCAKCKPKHLKPQNILLECGEGTGSKTFTSSDDVPFQLAHVTVDTTCLNKPQVLIKFTSLIRMEVLEDFGATVRLQYELFRACDGAEPISLGLWMFEKVDVFQTVFENIEEAFNFIFCECQGCHGCSDYFVTVTPVEIINATATVNNGRMAALSQSLCNSTKEFEDFDTKYSNTKFDQKHPKPKELLLQCGQGNGGIFFREETDPSANIAHVAVDTTCLSKPEVLIEFSSIIKLDGGILELRLQFELFRRCEDSEPISLGTWRFERTGVTVNNGLDEAFGFISCQNGTCPGCCEYFVTVTVLNIDSNSPDASVSVNNGRMTALVQPSKVGYYHDEYKSNDEKCDCVSCQSKHSKPKKILLECGSGTGNRTFTSSSQENPFQLAQVTIDTTCLCKPVANIEFSSIVSFEVLTGFSGGGRLRYELFRACDSGAPISLGVWSIGRINFSSKDIDRVTTTFDFTFCECLTCPRCCDYFVTVTPVGILGEGFTATVRNSRMAALAQEG